MVATLLVRGILAGIVAGLLCFGFLKLYGEPQVDRAIAFEAQLDEGKAAANVRKHRVTFELASTVFQDPRLFTVADLEHSEIEKRWFSIGWASNGVLLCVAYLWLESDPAMIKIRLISAREATSSEVRYYKESL